jgi:uncharacterized protein (TIGR02246 family)
LKNHQGSIDEKLARIIMKAQVPLALALLLFGFAVPAPGQENNAVDPQVRRQIEELNVKYDKAFNENDAEAIAALFTWNGVETGPDGQAFGQPDIEERYGVLFQLHPTSHLSKLVQVYAIGSRVCAITKWTARQKKDTSQPMLLREGYIVTVNVREEDVWKIEMLYSSYK